MNPLHDLHNYPDTLKISQLMKFCEKKGLNITRAMVQNYIRDGLLPPPVKKRIYTHKHLAALVMIDRLKKVFEMPEISAVLVPLMDGEGLPLDVYSNHMQKTEALAQEIFTATDGDKLLTMSCAARLAIS
jgi:DNA-binding transcriptional MerR regulator